MIDEQNKKVDLKYNKEIENKEKEMQTKLFECAISRQTMPNNRSRLVRLMSRQRPTMNT